jgi:hypothetical protein
MNSESGFSHCTIRMMEYDDESGPYCHEGSGTGVIGEPMSRASRDADFGTPIRGEFVGSLSVTTRPLMGDSRDLSAFLDWTSSSTASGRVSRGVLSHSTPQLIIVSATRHVFEANCATYPVNLYA